MIRVACSLFLCVIRRGMHAGADGWKSFAMWTAWTAYICFAIAFTLARSDGPSGQGFSSLRVESLLSKMTLEDKVRLFLSLFHCLHWHSLSCGFPSSAIIHPRFSLMIMPSVRTTGPETHGSSSPRAAERSPTLASRKHRQVPSVKYVVLCWTYRREQVLQTTAVDNHM